MSTAERVYLSRFLVSLECTHLKYNIYSYNVAGNDIKCPRLISMSVLLIDGILRL